MSGWAASALSTAGQNGLWLVQQLVHAVEVNPKTSSWAIPQHLAKAAFITGLFFAHVANVNGMVEFKRACLAFSAVSFALSYAFRKLFIAEQAYAQLAQKNLDEIKAAMVLLNNEKALKDKAIKDKVDAEQELADLKQAIEDAKKKEDVNAAAALPVVATPVAPSAPQVNAVVPDGFGLDSTPLQGEVVAHNRDGAATTPNRSIFDGSTATKLFIAFGQGMRDILIPKPDEE